MTDLKYFEILAKNKALEGKQEGEPVRIKVLSNIIVHQLKEILEYKLRSEGIPAAVDIGNYDNILQDTSAINKEKVIVFWELANVVDQFPYLIEGYSEESFTSVKNKLEGEISLLFESLKKAPFVLLNLFSALPFSSHSLEDSRLDRLAEEMNFFIKANAPKNFQLVQLDKIYSMGGLDNMLDLRNFYSSKALYKPDFFKGYIQHVYPALAAASGRIKKALILDCDNTLWGGILGEDGFDNLKMSSGDHSGIPYYAIQNIALQLNKEGILLGICSKNNPEDVDQIITSHQDLLIKEEHLTIKKVNWNNKAENLRQIAQELNIGLDSLVFVDDSDFEVNLVREQLPQVTVFQVPKKVYQYPALFQEIAASFFNPYKTGEDRNKAAMYQAQSKRAEAKDLFASMEDYLRSMQIEATVLVDEPSIVPRIAQMTQKTNQFNLTTKRYTEAEIEYLVNSEDHKILALRVKDKFGDSGITGLAIISYEGETAIIDSFLMSCRIIGRNIEFVFFDYIMQIIEIDKVSATFRQTFKNQQVEEFYDKLGFSEVKVSEGEKEYFVSKADYKYHRNIDYIKLNNERTSKTNNGVCL